MGYFTTRQDFFVCSSSIAVEERTKLDRFLVFLEDSGVGEILKNVKPTHNETGGRPSYNRYNLFAAILFGFAFSSGSLRDLESLCQFDLRYMYLMNQQSPSYVVFGNFMNDFVIPNMKQIFACLTRQIVKECSVEMEDGFIDGTKIEANANKYKFTWKPTTYHIRLCDKVRTLLEEYDLGRGIPENGIFPSKMIADKINEFAKRNPNYEVEKKLLSAYQKLQEYLQTALKYEEQEEICGPDRNSYYKTDKDATAMTLKTDYYSGLASNMHAAYNAQILVIKGFVTAYFVSQARNDITEFIPVLDNFYELYHQYPKNICADAGYGSLENYRYMKEKDITSYVKHQSWEGNVSGKRPDRYRYNGDKTITCLNGKIGTPAEAPHKPHGPNVTFYRVTGCRKCEFRKYCKQFQKRKSENFKYFEVNEELSLFKQESEDNLLSPKGIEIRVNRSCQVEGAYGVLKQNMQYVRFRRIGLEKVTAEFAMIFLGYNIRKLFRFYSGNLKDKYWTAPEDLKGEKFKKPSSKRLTKRAEKK